MPKSKLRGGKKAHRKKVANRNNVIHQKKLALTKQIIAQMNEKNSANQDNDQVGEGV